MRGLSSLNVVCWLSGASSVNPAAAVEGAAPCDRVLPGGPPPPPPGRLECGEDPTPDDLGCNDFLPCP